jgi:hypothetical protein
VVSPEHSRSGMELVQVAIIIAIALLIAFIFRDKIKAFVNDVFSGLKASEFQDK